MYSKCALNNAASMRDTGSAGRYQVGSGPGGLADLLSCSYSVHQMVPHSTWNRGFAISLSMFCRCLCVSMFLCWFSSAVVSYK